MVRVVEMLLLAAMVVHLVRPLGLPGLKTRADAWKIAAVAFLIFAVVAVTKGE